MVSNQFRFGVFEFDCDTRELRREGELVRLQSQPAQVLSCLLEHAGEVVSREELRQRVWQEHTFVDFERGLNFCVAQIRAALKDSPTQPQFIRTIPKRGYQFIASVQRVGSNYLLPIPVAIGFKVRTIAVIAACCLLIMASFWAGYWTKKQGLIQKAPVVAVLRFDNETGDPNMNGFSDAITDMLVVNLTAKADAQYSVIGNAHVLRVPREQRDLNVISSSLGASYVVLGQVQRSGKQTRILAHLIHLPDQTHVWVTRIEQPIEDPFAVESQVAHTVAEQFSPKIRTSFVPFASHRRASL